MGLGEWKVLREGLGPCMTRFMSLKTKKLSSSECGEPGDRRHSGRCSDGLGKSDRAHEEEEEQKGLGLFGSLNPRTDFLTCDSITRNCVSLTVPGPPQRSRPVEVNKKDTFQDQCILFSQFMEHSRLTILSAH